MNKIEVRGRITSNGIEMAGEGDSRRARFGVTDFRKKGEEFVAQFWNVTAWSEMGGDVLSYYAAGDYVVVTGRVEEYETADGVKKYSINARDISKVVQKPKVGGVSVPNSSDGDVPF